MTSVEVLLHGSGGALGAVVQSQPGGVTLTTLLVESDGIAAALDAAVRASRADFVGWLPARGELDSIAGLVELIDADPETDMVYADEAVRGGRRRVHEARPDFSPERLRNQDYLGRAVFYRREFLESIGGISLEHPGAEGYELALRASRSARVVAHLRSPLYVGPPRAPLDDVGIESTRRALEHHMAATGGGRVLRVGADGVHDTRREVVGEPLVSIVIPTRGTYERAASGTSYLLGGIRSIIELSTYSNLEFVIVIDDVAEPGVVIELESLLGDRLSMVPWSRPFNFSEKINAGVVRARGEYVLILNDDIQVLTPDWIEALLALAQLPGAGMSGAMLYYEDDTIQHAGHHYYGGDASHIGLDMPRGDPGPLNGYRVEREVSGVTAACAMMPRSVYFEVGGMSTLLPGNFNDVDICMKVTWTGHRIYWTPHAELYHFESKTRDASVRSFEVHVAWGRWGFRMHDSQYWPYPQTRTPAPA